MVKTKPIIIGALLSVPKGLLSGLEELEISRIETIQTIALLRTPEYWEGS